MASGSEHIADAWVHDEAAMNRVATSILGEDLC